MRRSCTCICLGFLMGALVACSGDDSGSDVGTPTPDAGQETPDSGVEPDAGTPDSGVEEGCNPVDGTGCPTDRFCVLQRDVNEGQCRELIDTVPLGQECSLLQQNCEVGQACSFFTGDDNAICRQVCRLGSNQNCQALGADFDCIIFSSLEDTFGYCGSTAPECDPLDPATCPNANETCGFRLNILTCIDVGTTDIGGNCEQENCVTGAVCLRVGNINNGDAICYEPCDSNTSCTLPNHMCQGVQEIDTNFCFPN